MLIIRKGLLYIFSAASTVFIIILAIDGYYIVKQAHSFTDIMIKYYAEHFIYLALLFIIGLIAGLTHLHVKSRDLLKELDNISDLSRFNLKYTSRYLSKLGGIGAKINRL